MQNPPKAFLFDLNGTMIDDMNYHINAWHRILNKLGANISLEKAKENCYGKNNELIERFFPDQFTEQEKNRMSIEKETEYQQLFKPHLQLLPGLYDFLKKANEKNIKMAIGSAAIMYNIDFVLNNLNIRQYFDAIVSADDVAFSKPNPETYLKCAEKLNLIPAECVVFEDSPKGVESALLAGMQSVVITIMHEKNEFEQFPNVEMFIRDYTSSNLNNLFTDNIPFNT